MEISTLVAANNNNLFCTFLTHQSHDGGQRSGQGPEATRRTPVVLGISGHALHIIIALFFIMRYFMYYYIQLAPLPIREISRNNFFFLFGFCVSTYIHMHTVRSGYFIITNRHSIFIYQPSQTLGSLLDFIIII